LTFPQIEHVQALIDAIVASFILQCFIFSIYLSR
jgi:hypothetical protein